MRELKFKVIVFLLASALLVMTSCTKENIQPNEPTPLPVVIEQPFVDGSWNILGYDGVELGNNISFTEAEGVIEITYGEETILFNNDYLGCVWNSETEAIVNGFTWTFIEGLNNTMQLWQSNPNNGDYLVFSLERI